jgi:hypothetical protein
MCPEVIENDSRGFRIKELNPLFMEVRKIAEAQKEFCTAQNAMNAEFHRHIETENHDRNLIEKGYADLTFQVKEIADLLSHMHNFIVDSFPLDASGTKADKFAHREEHHFIKDLIKAEELAAKQREDDAREAKKLQRKFFYEVGYKILIGLSLLLYMGKEAVPMLIKAIAG